MQAGVFYYAREGYYRHLYNAALERLKQFGSDPVLLFWKAYAIIMEGSKSDCMMFSEIHDWIAITESDQGITACDTM